MATKAKLGRVKGDLASLNIEITVWNDDYAELLYDDALTAALNVAPATLYGLVPSGNPTVEEKSEAIYLFGINYQAIEKSKRDPPPPAEVGTVVRRASCSTKQKELHNFLDPVGVFSADGDVTSQYPKTKWLINLGLGSGMHYWQEAKGAAFEPLPETRTLDYYVPNATLTNSYLDAIEDLVTRGAFNGDTFFGKPAGSVQFVRFSASERTADDWELSFGFGYVPPRIDLKVNDSITIPEVRGCDYYWTKIRTKFDDANSIMLDEAWLAVVGQVWDLDDFSVLGLS